MNVTFRGGRGGRGRSSEGGAGIVLLLCGGLGGGEGK
jgi:hypothetical protein